MEQLIREKRLLFAAHAARSAENSVCEQMDRECKEGTRWGKMLKRDLDDYGFQTLGNLADYEAKYARQSVWRKRKFYREEEDPQKEVYTPEEERHAQIRRESEAEFDESFLNNQAWMFASRASLNFTTVFGKSYRVQKVEANDFHGQLIGNPAFRYTFTQTLKMTIKIRDSVAKSFKKSGFWGNWRSSSLSSHSVTVSSF